MPTKADLFNAQLFLLNTGDRLNASLVALQALPAPGTPPAFDGARIPFGAVVGLFAAYARSGGVGSA